MNDARTPTPSRAKSLPRTDLAEVIRDLTETVMRLTTRVDLLEARLRRLENPLADYKPAPGMGKIVDLPPPAHRPEQPSDGTDDWRTDAERRGESKVIPMTTGDLKPVGPMELGYHQSLWHRRAAERAPRTLPERGKVS